MKGPSRRDPRQADAARPYHAAPRRLVAPSRRCRLCGVCALLLLCGVGLSAQNVTEPALRAAIIYNLAKFTVWPDDVLPPQAPFVVCVFGDEAVRQALERLAKVRLLAGHTVKVASAAIGAPLRSCHVLYVSTITGAEADLIQAVVHGAPVMTILDAESLLHGGVARVFRQTNGTLRFDLDHGLAKRSRLELSAQLLRLATTVRDEPAPVNP